MKNVRESYYPQADRWSYLWLIIGVLLSTFIAGNWPLALAAWLAPLFIIRFMRSQKAGRGFLLVVVGLSLVMLPAFSGAANPNIMPEPLFALILGLIFGLFYLLDRLIVARLPFRGFASFGATLVLPLLYTAYEFLWFNRLIFGSSGSMAYAQGSNLVLMQLTSLTGLWGLVFIPIWFATTANWIWERELAWPEIRRGVAVFGAVLLLLLAYGTIRMRFFAPQAGTVRVHGFVAGDMTAAQLFDEIMPLADTEPELFRQRAAAINNLYLEGTVREARAGAQIVVWPEVAAVAPRQDYDALLARSGQIARSENIYVALSALVVNTETDWEARSLIVDPSGAVVVDHLKYAYGLGLPISQVRLTAVDTPYGRLSTVLCGDLDNPGVVSQAGRLGADILLVPAFEPSPDAAPWHYRMAPFRAVENGFSIFRPTLQGTSIATDPYGRIIAQVDAFTANQQVLVAQLPTNGVPTVFAAVGDLFGWLTVAGSVAILLWLVVRWRAAAVEAEPKDRPAVAH